jgi:DNA-binding response OmpR family regulator
MHILVLEDEPLVAVDIAATIADAGWQVVGPAGSVPRALRLIEERGCHAAVLDANLGGTSAAPVADTLKALGIPFIVLSGYNAEQLPAALSRAPFLTKPSDPEELVATVRNLGSAAAGTDCR